MQRKGFFSKINVVNKISNSKYFIQPLEHFVHEVEHQALLFEKAEKGTTSDNEDRMLNGLYKSYLVPRLSPKKIQIIPANSFDCIIQMDDKVYKKKLPAFDVYFGEFFNREKFTFYILKQGKDEYILVKSEKDEILLDKFCQYITKLDPHALRNLGLAGKQGCRLDEIGVEKNEARNGSKSPALRS